MAAGMMTMPTRPERGPAITVPGIASIARLTARTTAPNRTLANGRIVLACQRVAERRMVTAWTIQSPKNERLLVCRLRGGVDAASDIGTQRAYYVDRL